MNMVTVVGIGLATPDNVRYNGGGWQSLECTSWLWLLWRKGGWGENRTPGQEQVGTSTRCRDKNGKTQWMVDLGCDAFCRNMRKEGVVLDMERERWLLPYSCAVGTRLCCCVDIDIHHWHAAPAENWNGLCTSPPKFWPCIGVHAMWSGSALLARRWWTRCFPAPMM